MTHIVDDFEDIATRQAKIEEDEKPKPLADIESPPPTCEACNDGGWQHYSFFIPFSFVECMHCHNAARKPRPE